MSTERSAILRWKRGHEAAQAKQLEHLRREGPRPEQALAELDGALEALEAMGHWPAPRDPISERAVEDVRRRWVKIEQSARKLRSR